MSGKRYPEEFKIEAVKQVIDRGHSVSSVATRLDVTTHSFYAWIKKYGSDSPTNNEKSDAQAEIRHLQKELKRVTDERDISKKPRRTSQSFPTKVRLYPRQQMLLACSFALLGSGCPSWWILFLASAVIFTASPADQMLTGQIKQFWFESGCVYGYRKIHLDLRYTGQQCGVNRVWRLMKRAGIKAQVGYRGPRARKDSIVASNRLQRQFNPDSPDVSWVTDMTYSVPGVQGEHGGTNEPRVCLEY